MKTYKESEKQDETKCYRKNNKKYGRYKPRSRHRAIKRQRKIGADPSLYLSLDKLVSKSILKRNHD